MEEIVVKPLRPMFRQSERNPLLRENTAWVAVVSKLAPGGRLQVAPGTQTDGASIPWFVPRWLVGDPFHPLYEVATLVHDVLYRYGMGSQQRADALFLALIKARVSEILDKKERRLWTFRANLMYLALRAFGWLYWNNVLG